MTRQPPFLLFTGPSGAGKSTVLDALLARSGNQIQRYITTTTRVARPGEEHGIHYWFSDRASFEQGIQEGAFFEYADVYGNYYGSDKRELDRLRALKKPMAMVIDVKGARTMKKMVPEAVTVYLDAPQEQLVRRLRARDLPPQELERRLAEMAREAEFKQEADVVILNEDGELRRTIEAVERALEERT